MDLNNNKPRQIHSNTTLTHKDVGAPAAVWDDLAASQVLYPEAQVAITLVRFKERGVGELAKVRTARHRVDEVRPVALTLQGGADVLRCHDKLEGQDREG